MVVMDEEVCNAQQQKKAELIREDLFSLSRNKNFFHICYKLLNINIENIKGWIEKCRNMFKFYPYTSHRKQNVC